MIVKFSCSIKILFFCNGQDLWLYFNLNTGITIKEMYSMYLLIRFRVSNSCNIKDTNKEDF